MTFFSESISGQRTFSVVIRTEGGAQQVVSRVVVDPEWSGGGFKGSEGEGGGGKAQRKAMQGRRSQWK